MVLTQNFPIGMCVCSFAFIHAMPTIFQLACVFVHLHPFMPCQQPEHRGSLLFFAIWYSRESLTFFQLLIVYRVEEVNVELLTESKI